MNWKKMLDIKKLPYLFASQKIKLDKKEKTLKTMAFYRGEGCRRCNNSGYKSRIGIYEILEIDKELVQKINERANADAIKEYARDQGMITMLEDGLVKAKQGITSIEEVLRVTRD